MSNTDASVCFSISSPNQSNVVEQRTPSSEKKNRSRNSRRSPQSQLNSNESKENGNSGSGKRKQRFRRVESPLKGKLNFPSNAHSNGDKTSYNNINNCINNDINNDDIDNENAITTIINETHSNDAQPLVAIENKIQSAADLTKWNRPQQQVRNFHAPQLPSKMHENTSKDIDSVEILARDQENESVRPSGTATVKALPQSTSLVGLRQAFAAVRNNHSLCNLSSQSANVIE